VTPRYKNGDGGREGASVGKPEGLSVGASVGTWDGRRVGKNVGKIEVAASSSD
jgi:hypothetical protein